MKHPSAVPSHYSILNNSCGNEAETLDNKTKRDHQIFALAYSLRVCLSFLPRFGVASAAAALQFERLVLTSPMLTPRRCFQPFINGTQPTYIDHYLLRDFKSYRFIEIMMLLQFSTYWNHFFTGIGTLKSCPVFQMSIIY